MGICIYVVDHGAKYMFFGCHLATQIMLEKESDFSLRNKKGLVKRNDLIQANYKISQNKVISFTLYKHYLVLGSLWP